MNMTSLRMQATKATFRFFAVGPKTDVEGFENVFKRTASVARAAEKRKRIFEAYWLRNRKLDVLGRSGYAARR